MILFRNLVGDTIKLIIERRTDKEIIIFRIKGKVLIAMPRFFVNRTDGIKKRKR